MMEMDTWKSSPIIRRLDGSWEIVYDGLPYYVSDMPGFEALYTKVTEYAEAHPEQVMDEPAPPAPTAAELLEQAKARKTASFNPDSPRQRMQSPIAPCPGKMTRSAASISAALCVTNTSAPSATALTA